MAEVPAPQFVTGNEKIDFFKQDLDDASKNITNFQGTHEIALSNFAPIWNEAKRNFNMRRGEHWTTEEKLAIQAKGRFVMNIPIIENKFQFLEAQQMAARYDWRALGRGSEDELGAEIVTHLFSYVKELNDFESIESEIFSSGLCVKYGVAERLIDRNHNPEGDVMIRKVPYNEFMWDLNCQEYDISKYATWCQRFGWFTKDQLTVMYPDKVDIINGLSENTSKNNNSLLNLINWYKSADNGQQLCKVVWHYQRKNKIIYKTFYDDGSMMEFDNIAHTKLPKKVSGMDPMTGGISDQILNVLQVIPRPMEYILATCFSADSQAELSSWIINCNESGYARFPYHPYFSFFQDGKFWTQMDLAIDPQRIIDRTFMQIDFGLAKSIKGANYELYEPGLHQDEKNNMGATVAGLAEGGTIVKKITPGTVITPINSGTIQPQLFDVLEMQNKVLDQAVGGAVIQGQADYSGQSGKAIKALQAAGLQKNLGPIDQLRRWRKALGEGVFEDMKEVYQGEREIRILGTSMTDNVKLAMQQAGVYNQSQTREGVGYLKINSNGMPNISDLKLDIVVTDSPNNDITKELQYDQLMELEKLRLSSGQPSLGIELLTQYMDIDATVKAKLIKSESDAQIAQQQQAQQQQELQMKQMQFEGENKLADINLKKMELEHQHGQIPPAVNDNKNVPV